MTKLLSYATAVVTFFYTGDGVHCTYVFFFCKRFVSMFATNDQVFFLGGELICTFENIEGEK